MPISPDLKDSPLTKSFVPRYTKSTNRPEHIVVYGSKAKKWISKSSNNAYNAARTFTAPRMARNLLTSTIKTQSL